MTDQPPRHKYQLEAKGPKAPHPRAALHHVATLPLAVRHHSEDKRLKVPQNYYPYQAVRQKMHEVNLKSPSSTRARTTIAASVRKPSHTVSGCAGYRAGTCFTLHVGTISWRMRAGPQTDSPCHARTAGAQAHSLLSGHSSTPAGLPRLLEADQSTTSWRAVLPSTTWKRQKCLHPQHRAAPISKTGRTHSSQGHHPSTSRLGWRMVVPQSLSTQGQWETCVATSGLRKWRQ